MTAKQLRLARRRVQDRNRRFKEMAPERKRIAIAKDVIRMLDEGGLKARSGTYLRVDDMTKMKASQDPEKQLQELLCGASCTVCGIGGAFVAAVLRADQCTFADLDGYWGNDDYMREYLEEWFEPIQVSLIECAFERSTSFARSGQYGAAVKAAAFGERFAADKARLRAIMENIVQNDGEFVPPDEP